MVIGVNQHTCLYL